MESAFDAYIYWPFMSYGRSFSIIPRDFLRIMTPDEIYPAYPLMNIKGKRSLNLERIAR
jgi:hypothetical protein